MPEPKTLPQLLRIMDVATALRREREAATAHLSAAETRAQLRERLRATAAASGEEVTTAEIDAAINHYYSTLHRFEEPPRSLKWILAHLYVRRGGIAAGLIGLVILATLAWFVLDTVRKDQTSEPKTTTSKPSNENTTLTHARAVHGAIRSLAVEPEAQQEADRLLAETEALARGAPAKELEASVARLLALRAVLEEAYELRVVSRPGERSGIEGTFNDAVTGYYLIVEAVTADGRVLKRPIRDAELGRIVQVTKWGEQVPKPVYDRIGADKRQDGVVDEALFGRKVRGKRHEEILMKDGNEPVRRGRQITRGL